MSALDYESSCTGDCQQGRLCDCAPEDPVAAPRGILNGLLLAIPFWAVVALLLWWRS